MTLTSEGGKGRDVQFSGVKEKIKCAILDKSYA